MATQAQLDAVKALIRAGDFDQARTAFREEWDELFLNFAMDVSVQGRPPVRLENLSISESWNLNNQSVESFGGSCTHVYGVPTVDGATVNLPVTGVFVPPQGYRFTIRNGSDTNRLTVDPDGAATVDGMSTLDVEPRGVVELLYEGIETKPINGQDETAYDDSPTTEGTFAGGTAHAVSDLLTLSDGTLVTVDAVSSGVVTQFTVNSVSSSGATANDTLTQTTTTGSGAGFSLTVDVDNLAAGRDYTVLASSSVEQIVRLPMTAVRATLDAAPAGDNGGGLVGLPATAHGLSAGTRVEINGTTNYDGEHVLDATTTTNELVIADTFVSETFAGTETVTAALITWQNPLEVPLLVRLVVNLTTAATGTCTGDFGRSATPATSDDLLDGVDLNAAVDVFASPAGTNGRNYRVVGVGEYVTGSVANVITEDPTGLVGKAHIFYHAT